VAGAYEQVFEHQVLTVSVFCFVKLALEMMFEMLVAHMVVFSQ